MLRAEFSFGYLNEIMACFFLYFFIGVIICLLWLLRGEKTPVDWPIPQRPCMEYFNVKTTNIFPPVFSFLCSMDNMWPEPCRGKGLSPPHTHTHTPTHTHTLHLLSIDISVWVWAKFSFYVCLYRFTLMPGFSWKDEANDTQRHTSQVKWYCLKQRLYIATQTGLQDEYNVFWLNTEQTQPCRQKQRDCNRQDSSGGFFKFNLLILNQVLWKEVLEFKLLLD